METTSGEVLEVEKKGRKKILLCKDLSHTTGNSFTKKGQQHNPQKKKKKERNKVGLKRQSSVPVMSEPAVGLRQNKK